MTKSNSGMYPSQFENYKKTTFGNLPVGTTVSLTDITECEIASELTDGGYTVNVRRDGSTGEVFPYTDMPTRRIAPTDIFEKTSCMI